MRLRTYPLLLKKTDIAEGRTCFSTCIIYTCNFTQKLFCFLGLNVLFLRICEYSVISLYNLWLKAHTTNIFPLYPFNKPLTRLDCKLLLHDILKPVNCFCLFLGPRPCCVQLLRLEIPTGSFLCTYGRSPLWCSPSKTTDPHPCWQLFWLTFSWYSFFSLMCTWMRKVRMLIWD